MKKTFHELSEQDIQTVSGGLAIDFSGLLNEQVALSNKLVEDAGVIVDDSAYAVKVTSATVRF